MAHKFIIGDKVIFDINKNWGDIHMSKIKKYFRGEMSGVITNYTHEHLYRGVSGVIFHDCYGCRIDINSSIYSDFTSSIYNDFTFTIPQEYIIGKEV